MTFTNNESGKLKDPRRVEIGRRNRALQGPATERQRQRARETAMQHQPWRYSTGPRTAEGKARSAANAQRRTMDEGLAELQRIQREVLATIDDAQKIRARIAASSCQEQERRATG